MTDAFIQEKILKLLDEAEFMNLATVDVEGRPSASNKFLLKHDGKSLYIIDFVKGKTWMNLKNNPTVSLTIMDKENLIDYQINGMVEIIEKGPEYNRLVKEFDEKNVRFSTNRIIEGIRRAKVHDSHELPLPKKILVLKVNVKEVVGLGPAAELKNKSRK